MDSDDVFPNQRPALPTATLRISPSVCRASWSDGPSLRHRQRKLAHLAVSAHLALQSRPAFTQTAPAYLFSPPPRPSIYPSLPPPPTLYLPPQPACFLSLSWKVDPLHSSEIKTGRCKLQINVIKCLRYHRPSHWSG